jgi:internalin A
MERHEEGQTAVIPVIVRDVQWHGAPFAKCQPLPRDGKPVTIRGRPRYARDSAWRNVAEGIERVVKELRPDEG